MYERFTELTKITTSLKFTEISNPEMLKVIFPVEKECYSTQREESNFYV